MQPQQSIAAPVEVPVEKKKGGSSAIIMACLGILAVAGIGFGVYGFMKKPETKVETKVETVVSKEAAASILKPYLGFSPISIMDGLSAGNKIHYASIFVNGIFDPEGDIYYYKSLDNSYFDLFGEHLEKTTVVAGQGVTFTYNPDRDWFLETGAAWGSPNPAYEKVTSIKEVNLTDDGLSIVFYQDSVPVCEYIGTDMGANGASEEYCISNEKLGMAGMNEFAENHEGMPTYTFTFGVKDDRYVLVDTEKNETDEVTE